MFFTLLIQKMWYAHFSELNLVYGGVCKQSFMKVRLHQYEKQKEKIEAGSPKFLRSNNNITTANYHPRHCN